MLISPEQLNWTQAPFRTRIQCLRQGDRQPCLGPHKDLADDCTRLQGFVTCEGTGLWLLVSAAGTSDRPLREEVEALRRGVGSFEITLCARLQPEIRLPALFVGLSRPSITTASRDWLARRRGEAKSSSHVMTTFFPSPIFDFFSR